MALIDITRKHLGFYEINGVRLRNKAMALQMANAGQWPHWNFNDDVFGSYDWKIEPQEDLYEIYRQRAEQIRSRYDKVILLFSGGIDSITVLRTFLEHKIKLDAVVSYGSFSLNDWKSHVRNQEIANSAIPYIKECEKIYNTKINYYLLDDWPLFENFTDESWVHATNGSSLSPEVFVYNFHHKPAFMQDIMSQGKTVILRGVDKPRLVYDEGTWMLRFLDKQTGGFHTSGLNDISNTWYEVEYFFWTRDMPKLLCKQAHRIKNYFQNKDEELVKKLFDSSNGFMQSEYYKWIDPLIYDRYLTQLPGEDRNYFTVGKSTHTNAMVKDQVFFQKADDYNKQVWDKGIDYIMGSIDHSFMEGKKTEGLTSKETFLEKGFIGMWSNPYYLN